MKLVNAKSRGALFQVCGGVVGLVVAAAPIYAAKTAFGELGRFALLLSVPLGVIIGWLLVALLQFAYRILVEES